MLAPGVVDRIVDQIESRLAVDIDADVKYAATYLYINDVYVVRPKLP